MNCVTDLNQLPVLSFVGNGGCHNLGPPDTCQKMYTNDCFCDCNNNQSSCEDYDGGDCSGESFKKCVRHYTLYAFILDTFVGNGACTNTYAYDYPNGACPIKLSANCFCDCFMNTTNCNYDGGDCNGLTYDKCKSLYPRIINWTNYYYNKSKN